MICECPPTARSRWTKLCQADWVSDHFRDANPPFYQTPLSNRLHFQRHLSSAIIADLILYAVIPQVELRRADDAKRRAANASWAPLIEAGVEFARRISQPM